MSELEQWKKYECEVEANREALFKVLEQLEEEWNKEFSKWRMFRNKKKLAELEDKIEVLNESIRFLSDYNNELEKHIHQIEYPF
jgi:molybdopterin converting factor small subunit